MPRAGVAASSFNVRVHGDDRDWHGWCFVQGVANSRGVHPLFLLDPSLPVETVMTPPVAIPVGIGAHAARLELADSGCEEIFVVDASFRPLGVCANEPVATEWCPSELSLPRRARPGAEECDPEGWPEPTPTATRVDDIMVPIRARIAAGSSIAHACALMAGAHCTRAAIVNASGRLIGLVTASSVLAWIASSVRMPWGHTQTGVPPEVGA